ncbi:HAMP domain-containing histidine kinase [Microcoleus sp. FACHB-SPT15]|uniref:sensor histidine kinase n=1 Tax=Microcoleus sp. FACHB-SPT15 TaxID=2692830 RepID=UPI00177C40FD|nr:HAMP domain-containing sensor histidine kinase [Microcoleus sp. FACHB-SPT15]MBD1806256.1 HAMP domain-containing histidine kinase [Microcoleus sp. FACHB-SPT15]
MSNDNRKYIWQLRYGFAVAMVTLALLLTLLLYPLLHKTPGVLFFAAVMLSSWYGGFRPGVVATILSVSCINYFFLAPYFALSYATADILVLAVFTSTALLVSYLNAARIKAENALRQRAIAMAQMNKDLENRVRERTSELEQALEREKELSSLKSRLVATISHEYRTPLTTIQSSAELLEHYSHKWTQEKKLTHLQRIQASTKHLSDLVSDVLFIGKAEADKLEFNPVPLDLEGFCRELVEQMQLLSVTNEITLIFHSQGNCTNASLDERLLRQILTNLLSNAIKYSPRGSTVRFDLECIGGDATLRIKNSGIGIPAEDLPRLFDSFHRASNVGAIPGTGLGLAIVKKCVDLHGGQITVDSVEEVNTTFTVILPLSSKNVKALSL